MNTALTQFSLSINTGVRVVTRRIQGERMLLALREV